MELFICGRNPLIAQSNPVAWRGVLSSSRIVAYMSLLDRCVPMTRKIKSVLRWLCAPFASWRGRRRWKSYLQTYFKVSVDNRQPGFDYLWGGDGWLQVDGVLGKTIHPATKENFQDMWFIPQPPHPDDFFDDPPEPPHLGLLARNSAIFSIQQRPPLFTELASRRSRRPFLHALLRR